MATPSALILRAPGTNCDHEVQTAFEMVGGRGDRIHLNALRDNPKLLRNYQILVLPGGFSYGDDIAAGKVQAIYMQHFLTDALRAFRDDTNEKLILGICNGFQAMLKAGLLMPRTRTAALHAREQRLGPLRRQVDLPEGHAGQVPLSEGH